MIARDLPVPPYEHFFALDGATACPDGDPHAINGVGFRHEGEAVHACWRYAPRDVDPLTGKYVALDAARRAYFVIADAQATIGLHMGDVDEFFEVIVDPQSASIPFKSGHAIPAQSALGEYQGGGRYDQAENSGHCPNSTRIHALYPPHIQASLSITNSGRGNDKGRHLQ